MRNNNFYVVERFGEESLTGYLAVLAAGLLWAAGGLLVRYLQMFGLPAMMITFLRVALAWIFLSIWMLLTKPDSFRARPRDLLTFALLGVIGPAGSQSLYIWCVTLTTVAVAAILNYTAPIFVMILSRVFLNEHITPAKLFALVLTMAGLILITGVYEVEASVPPLALITGLGSGLLYATYTLILKKSSLKYHPFTINWWVMLFGLPLITLYSWPAFGSLPAMFSAAGIVAVLANGAGPGFLAFVLFTGALSQIQAGRVSIVATIEPVGAIILGFLILGETITLAQSFGVALVISGIVLVTIGGRTNQVERAESAVSSQISQ